MSTLEVCGDELPVGGGLLELLLGPLLLTSVFSFAAFKAWV